MKRIVLTLCLGIWLLLAAVTALASGRDADRVGALAPPDITSLAARSEFWRLGVTSEGNAAYTSTPGRLLSPVTTFRSYRGITDSYFTFAAPGSRRILQAARYYLLDRSGTYTSSTALSLEILAADGSVRHTVSSSAIDLKDTPTGAWVEMALSGNAADLEIMPGEFLAFHFHLNGTPEGDWIAHPLFEVQVQSSDLLAPPNTPAQQSPPDGVVTSTQAISLTWSASAGAAGYHLQVDGGTIVTTANTTWPVNLSVGIHTWTVRAYNSAGTSAWATPWTVEITDTLPPPATPQLLTPSNGSMTGPAPILVWQADRGATPTGYHVDVDGAVITLTQTSSPTLLSTGIHTWTVRAFNEVGLSSWALPWTLQVVEHETFFPLVWGNPVP